MDTIKELARILEEGKVKVCFCFFCSHSAEFGWCPLCHCGNHQPAPELDATALKMKAAIEHLRMIIRRTQADARKRAWKRSCQ